jgi:hypothetical protein
MWMAAGLSVSRYAAEQYAVPRRSLSIHGFTAREK